MKQLAVVTMLAAALSGCSEAEPTVAFCNGFGAGSTFQFNSCTNCAVANLNNGGDRNLTTETSVVPNAGALNETFVFTATSASDIASGGVVGFWFTQPAGLTAFDTDIETFRDGNPTPVETLTTNNLRVIFADEGTPAGGYVGMQTTQAFDVVRITRSSSWSAGTPVYRIYEVCSDGGAD